MTAASTLTDRYVFAVLRSLPEAQRADIDRELRGTIADAVDGQIEAGTDSAAAEREVITELGDPYRLASGYADRPLHLIGPALFPDYIRLLKVLYVIVLPIIVAAILLGQLLSHPDDIGGAIGSTWAAIISVAAHLGFWTTLVFAVIERSNTYKAQAWNPSTLPQLPVGSSIKLSDTVASIFWMATILIGIAWGQFWPLFRDSQGAAIPLFDQTLWSFWLPFFIVLALAELAFQLVLYRTRRWTWPLAVVNLVLGAAAVIPVVWLLLSEQLVNPAFLDAANIAPLFAGDGVVTIVLVVVLISTGLTDAVTGFVRAGRGGRVADLRDLRDLRKLGNLHRDR